MNEKLFEALGFESVIKRGSINNEGFEGSMTFEDVAKLELQWKEMLEALIDIVISNIEANKDNIPEAMMEDVFKGAIKIIEKACYPKKWPEIKELLNGKAKS